MPAPAPRRLAAEAIGKARLMSAHPRGFGQPAYRRGDPLIASRWEPAQCYPDPAIRTLDPRFDTIKPPFNAAVERLATGLRWGEGPVWFGDGRYLLWSDIPNNRIMRWDEETGAVSVFRKPSNYSNGNTRDRQGRLVTCEHDARRVTRTEYDGTITVLLDRFDGKPLNSPNDVVVKSDDSIWFTDPPFGIVGNYEGDSRRPNCRPTSTGSTAGPGAPPSSPATSTGPTGCAFRPTKRGSTSSSRAQRRAGSASSTWSTTAPGSPTAGSSSSAGEGTPGRLPLRRRRQSVVRLGHDRRRSTASSCSPRTGR